ncbi:hypothetical protein H4R35_000394 [Dimargaris xerosporica]|nr:hypothetical protein H4R35_000394 [Dimargaris xerosporica]
MRWAPVAILASASAALVASHAATSPVADLLGQEQLAPFHKYHACDLDDLHPHHDGGDSPALDQTAIAFVAENAQVPLSDVAVTSSYYSHHNRVRHVYLQQHVDGVPVVNSHATINVAAGGQILSSSILFMTGQGVKHADIQQGPRHAKKCRAKQQDHSAKRVPTKAEAVAVVLKSLGLSNDQVEFSSEAQEYSPATGQPMAPAPPGQASVRITQVTVTQAYYLLSSIALEPCWDVILQTQRTWYHAQISQHTGKVLALADWAAHIDKVAYRVFPFGVEGPQDRAGRQLVVNPFDRLASPRGWHMVGNYTYHETRGNNVIAQDHQSPQLSWDEAPKVQGQRSRRDHRPSGARYPAVDETYDFSLDLGRDPYLNTNASITNLFYWTNLLHDLFYRYGFDEAAGNFQEDNGNHGGQGLDAVVAYGLDGSSYYESQFVTPPDGLKPTLYMSLWAPPNDSDNPMDRRDSSFDSSILIHEFSHGLSSRLTGGSASADCLSFGNGRALGEGWSDAISVILRLKAGDTRRNSAKVIGGYVSHGGNLRTYPYSVDPRINPFTFDDLNSLAWDNIYDRGQVWATMLLEMYWNLVERYGYHRRWSSASMRHGNTLALQLIIDGLTLQPCRPSFITARDAILHADVLLTRGRNQCLIWKAFAKRGLGVQAKENNDQYTADYKVHRRCRSRPAH